MLVLVRIIEHLTPLTAIGDSAEQLELVFIATRPYSLQSGIRGPHVTSILSDGRRRMATVNLHPSYY